MIIQRIREATRTLGVSQGYIGLPIRDELVIDKTTGLAAPSMVTAWEPTPAELAAINAGKPIILRILGNTHPPVMLSVGDDPAEHVEL